MSDFTATVILVLCFYPLLPIIAGVMANEAKAKKNIVIACRFRRSTTRGCRSCAAGTKSRSGSGFSS